MNETRRTFLAAAETACSVLAWPAVSDGWDAASALPRMTVGHLVAHLARGVTMVERYLDQAAPEADSATISAAEYYAAMLGASGDMDSVLNSGVRDRATRDAAPGFSAVAASLYECTERLRGRVGEEPEGRVVEVFGNHRLVLDEYLVTRIVELTVHVDDLCVSIGCPTPPLPGGAGSVRTLVDVALVRHGAQSVLRALTRRERDQGDVLRVL